MSIFEKINKIETQVNLMKEALELPPSTPLEEVTVKVEQGGGGTPVKSNIYKAASIEERNAIRDMVEGDMCVVHTSTMANMQVTDSVTAITFPATVVLPEALTDYIFTSLRDADRTVDVMVDASNTHCRISIMMDPDYLDISYESSDGITYTRTDTNPETIEFGVAVSCVYVEEWNDLIGYFLQVGGATFDGLFEYKDSAWVYAKIGISTTPDYVYAGKDVYTNSGKNTGTLTEDVVDTLDDVNARVYAEIQEQYNAMPIIIAPEVANSLYSHKKLYTIPVKSDGTPLLDTSNVTDMSNMFCNCSNLTMVPQLDTSKVTNMYRMFWGCNSLTTIPLINTSQVTNMEGMFFGCNSLTTVPQLDTSSATNMRYMFDDCSLLTTIPLINTSQVTNMEVMFANNESLTIIPQLDTSKVTNMNDMFYGCPNLTTIPQLDTSNVMYINGIVRYCPNLTDESLNNILIMAKNSKVSNSKTTASLGLDATQKERIKSLPAYSSFISAGWKND